MDISNFIVLLSMCTTVAGLVTEAVKKLYNTDNAMSNNMIAWVVSLLVGAVGCAGYYMEYSVVIHAKEAVTIFFMGVATALCSMVGYDKVSQTVKQFNKI